MNFFINLDKQNNPCVQVFTRNVLVDITEQLVKLNDDKESESGRWNGLENCNIVPLFTKLDHSCFVIIQKDEFKGVIYFFTVIWEEDHLKVKKMYHDEEEENVI